MKCWRSRLSGRSPRCPPPGRVRCRCARATNQRNMRTSNTEATRLSQTPGRVKPAPVLGLSLRRKNHAGITAAPAWQVFHEHQAASTIGRHRTHSCGDRFLSIRGISPHRESTRMNKADFISSVADTAGLSKTDAANAVDAMVKVITQTLKSGEAVTLGGFGKFEVRGRAARQGRHPKTGEAIKINASNKPAFKARKALKDPVNLLSKSGVL